MSVYEHSEMTIAFDFVGGQLVPSVSFNPVGRIHPMTVEKHLGFLYREINKAQTLQRLGRGDVRFGAPELEAVREGRGEDDEG